MKYPNVKKCTTFLSLNEVYAAAVAFSEEDVKYVTIFITPPAENEDVYEYSAGEGIPGIVDFSRNMLQAEAEITVNEASDTFNKKAKTKEQEKL